MMEQSLFLCEIRQKRPSRGELGLRLTLLLYAAWSHDIFCVSIGRSFVHSVVSMSIKRGLSVCLFALFAALVLLQEKQKQNAVAQSGFS